MKSIAIVSAGVRFPEARSLDAFEALLREGRDVSREECHDERWLARAERKPKEEGYFHKRAYRLDEWQEDHPELVGLDPLFHVAYGAAKDAFSQVKAETLLKNRMGLIFGCIALPTETSSRLASEWLARALELGDTPQHSQAIYKANLSPASMPAKVVAKLLGIEGPAFTLDAACASSLYAIKLACDELTEGRLDLVLAGGVSRPDALYTQVGFTALDALSKSGRSSPLDTKADGLMVGEGAGLFALKRLEDAERHGDQILAVIRGAGLSNDKEGGLMAPSQEGQWRAMQAAYVDAEWDPRSVELIECHATGTALGDATEIKSLLAIRGGKSEAVLGSVKSNVGHMLTAAGAAGLAKILLSLREKTFYPTANFESSPKAWGLEEHGLRVLKTAEAWKTRADLRRASISGFGFGGINAHILIEEYQKDLSETVVRIRPKKRVAVLSASLWDEAQANSKSKSSFELGFKQFRIPPKEMKAILPQQVVSLLTMDRLKAMPFVEREKTGCFVGVELDSLTSLFATRWQLQDKIPGVNLKTYMPPLEANQVMGSLASIVASRAARELGLGGPSFTVSSGESSGLKALELAFRAISRGELSSALVMATDAQGSHRAKAQLHETFGPLWSSSEETSVGLVLMDEALALNLGLSVAVVLDDFVDFQNSLDRPLSEGDLWLEDMARDSAWLKTISHPSVRLVENHSYRGAAHGLYSLVKIWEEGKSKRASFLLRDQASHQLSWRQLSPLRLYSAEELQDPYEVPRFDQTLPNALELFSDVLQKVPAPMSEHSIEENVSIRQLPLPPASLTTLSARELSLADTRSNGFVKELLEQELQSISAHEEFLKFRNEGDELIINLMSLLKGETELSFPQRQKPWVLEPYNKAKALFDYEACEEFAVGKIAKVFGDEFQEIDSYPTRVRLPAERLLLCHRVMSISGTPNSLGAGRMVTEHDVYPDAWYLEAGDPYMPTSIAVEAGQADLMLSAYLGADFVTKGKAVYRLLDARVSFHSLPPKVGETIRYEIEIKRFFEQGGTLFFNFAFEGFVGDRHVISMVDGCAGFFTENALDEGRGVKRSQLQLKGHAGKVTGNYQPLVPMMKESFKDEQLLALRAGDYVKAFGQDFSSLPFTPKPFPGGDMELVHRILELDPKGGRFGIGSIIGEADIHPDDWFLTCHFIDDQVMPGTLMFECCLHTLRVFLMRSGWVGELGVQSLVPKAGIWSGLKCRGQVLATTRKVTYEIEIKEIGYGPDAYVICDALMYADGKAIVDITDMSLTLPGANKASFEKIWGQSSQLLKTEQDKLTRESKEPAFTFDHILAFSNGNPSECFGEVYKVFDKERKIARLPRPPFQFLDAIEWVEGPYMKQHVGTKLLAHYENPHDAWYWALNNDSLPFSVLVEIALQPCGFMAAYMGSALLSQKDLKFRNLSGEAVMLQEIRKGDGRLSIEVSSTKIAQSGDMIIQDYAFRVFNEKGDVYRGTTSFGFFTEEALAQQAGIRGEGPWKGQAVNNPYPSEKALPKGKMRMVNAWEHQGDKLFGAKKVDPNEWFFEAHFFEDPVMPGSLGLESLTQVAMAEADRRWPNQRWRVALGSQHNWMYRGQVRKHNKEVRLALDVKERGDKTLAFDSVLYCDGLAIYKLDSLKLESI